MKKIEISLKRFTKIGTGSKGLLYCPEKLDEIKKVPEDIQVIGNASNVLCEDRDYSFLNLRYLDLIQNNTESLKVYAGVLVSTLLRYSIENSLSGIEFLAGIPGNIGGIVCMNAGSLGKEIGDYISKVGYYDIKKSEIFETENKGNLFEYRNSIFGGDKIVLYVVLHSLINKKRTCISENIKADYIRKLNSQPVLKKTFGSVFKNPQNISAWKLLNQSGFQGKYRGGACFSQKHANFIENNNNATFNDIKYLIENAKEKVYNDTGILLEEEVRYM
jgi:UDP-N-acetylmuramate dehydrogenase